MKYAAMMNGATNTSKNKNATLFYFNKENELEYFDMRKVKKNGDYTKSIISQNFGFITSDTSILPQSTKKSIKNTFVEINIKDVTEGNKQAKIDCLEKAFYEKLHFGKALVEVYDPPKIAGYHTDNAVKTQYSDNGHFTREMFFHIGTIGNTSPLKNVYKNLIGPFNDDYIVPLSDNIVITEIHANNTVYYTDTTNGTYHVFDGGQYGGYTRPNKEIYVDSGTDIIKLTFPTKGGQVVYGLTVNEADEAYLVVEDITQTNTKEVYAKNVRLAAYDATLRTVNAIAPTDGVYDPPKIAGYHTENKKKLKTFLG